MVTLVTMYGDNPGGQVPDNYSMRAESVATQGLRPAQPLLVVEDLKTYFETPRGLVKAVDGVSLTLDRGQTLGIVGESGSGKSVLSRSIMGLLPKRNLVTEGTVIFDGKVISDMTRKQMRSQWGTEMAMVFQDPMTSLNPVVRVGRQITEGLSHHLGMSKKEANETAVSLLTEVGIPSPKRRLREYPHQLSGGMRQRVTIAIALACGPRLLMADEPTTALDVTVQAQILELLHREQTDRDMAMVLVTHDLGVVAGRADNIAVMYGGKIVERAPTRALFGNLKMPYTEALLRSIPRLKDKSHTRLHAIGGRPPDLLHPPAGCNFSPRCKYATQKCREEEPPLIEADDPDHVFACWNPVGSDEHGAALDRLGESPVGISSPGAAE